MKKSLRRLVSPLTALVVLSSTLSLNLTGCSTSDPADQSAGEANNAAAIGTMWLLDSTALAGAGTTALNAIVAAGQAGTAYAITIGQGIVALDIAAATTAVAIGAATFVVVWSAPDILEGLTKGYSAKYNNRMMFNGHALMLAAAARAGVDPAQVLGPNEKFKTAETSDFAPAFAELGKLISDDIFLEHPTKFKMMSERLSSRMQLMKNMRNGDFVAADGSLHSAAVEAALYLKSVVEPKAEGELISSISDRFDNPSNTTSFQGDDLKRLFATIAVDAKLDAIRNNILAVTQGAQPVAGPLDPRPFASVLEKAATTEGLSVITSQTLLQSNKIYGSELPQDDRILLVSNPAVAGALTAQVDVQQAQEEVKQGKQRVAEAQKEKAAAEDAKKAAVDKQKKAQAKEDSLRGKPVVRGEPGIVEAMQENDATKAEVSDANLRVGRAQAELDRATRALEEAEGKLKAAGEVAGKARTEALKTAPGKAMKALEISYYLGLTGYALGGGFACYTSGLAIHAEPTKTQAQKDKQGNDLDGLAKLCCAGDTAANFAPVRGAVLAAKQDPYDPVVSSIANAVSPGAIVGTLSRNPLAGAALSIAVGTTCWEYNSGIRGKSPTGL